MKGPAVPPTSSAPRNTAIDLLDAASELARALAERLAPAVVSLGRDHRGSGIVIAPGTVLTNAHNLADRTTQLTFADGRIDQAHLRGVDAAGDLAVLDADTAAIDPVPWADGAPHQGQVVFALAGSARGTRISSGIVSATERAFRGPGGRPIGGAAEHTAPLPRGASGGPLVDTRGRLVAVNTHRPTTGLYLARPADAALRDRIAALEGGAVVRPTRLGVVVAPAAVARRMRAAVGLAERDGLLVRGVVDDSPAARAGLRAGDLLVAAGGADLARIEDLFGVLAGHDTAQPLDVAVVRGSDELTVTVSFDATTADDPGSGPDADRPAGGGPDDASA